MFPDSRVPVYRDELRLNLFVRYAREWIPHCSYLLSSKTTAKGTGLAESAGKEDLKSKPPMYAISVDKIRHFREKPILSGPKVN